MALDPVLGGGGGKKEPEVKVPRTSASKSPTGRFLESYEATYGEPFCMRCPTINYSVSVENHNKDRTSEYIGDTCSVVGLGLLAVPAGPYSTFAGIATTAIGGFCFLSQMFSPDEDYAMYVVDVWGVEEWLQTSNGKWIGIASGEKHMFRINYDALSGRETLEYLGPVDFTHYTGVTPGECPCYQYYFHVDENWCRIP